MGGLDNRTQSIEDIMFEFKCLAFFKEMKREYKNSQLGFMFDDLNKTTKGHVLRLVKIHEKEFNEKLDVKMMRVEV